MTNPIKPVVSVCITSFNHQNFIKKSVLSVIEQKTNFPIEIIISDDCSVDETPEIIKELHIKYPEKIRLILHNSNIGAKKNGIEILKATLGQYTALLDGDDYWIDPLKLQKQVDFLEGNLNYSSCFHIVYITNSDYNDDIINKNIFGYNLTSMLTIDDLLLSKRPLIHTSSFMFRSELLSIPEWFEDVLAGDMGLFYLLADKGPVAKIPGVMSAYRDHEGGITKTMKFRKNRILERIKLINYFNKHSDFKYSKIINRIIEAFKKNTSVRLPLLYRIKRRIRITFNRIR